MLESISTSVFLAQAVEKPSFFESGTFLLFLLIAAIALGVFLSTAITKALEVSEFSGRMAVVLIPVFVAILMIWSGWPPKFGVDLRGGINMIGSLNLDQLVDDGARVEAKDIIKPLKQRVDPSGTREIMIRALGPDKIEVTIPSVDEQVAMDIWDRLVKAGKLEFRILANRGDFPNQIRMAEEMADSGNRGVPVRDLADLDDDGNGKIVAKWVSLARLVVPDGNQPEVVAFKFVPSARTNLVRDKSTGRILDISMVRYSGNPDHQGRELAEWAHENGYRSLQVLVIQPDEDENVEGKHLSSVRSTIDEKGRGSVSFDTTSLGAIRMGNLTRSNLNQPMGIVLDGQLHSAPVIESAIYSSGRITGEFTPEEVNELIVKLKSGKLEVALNKAPISKDFIESTLGQELKEKGIWAIASSLLLVLVFMVFYYRFSGVVATIALLLNLILILALVMMIQQPLTLTGLAGLVLTVGMSVDANVLIFERMREEIDRGAALRMAIRNGFDKATTTIVDANVTTLITALVLYVIGTEQIKGFAVTLILGISISMFTAIFVSRLIFDIFERRRWLTKLSMTRILERGDWNFLNKVKFSGVMSLIVIVVGLGGVYVLGARILDQDLRGGSTVRMVFNQPQDVVDIRTKLADENIMHNGEKIEFLVSAYGDKDEDLKFKVDSSLPAWEGELSGQDKFEQLDEIISRVFAGKLKLHSVSIEGGSPLAVERENMEKVDDPASSTETPSVGMKWQAIPVTSPISALVTSVLTYQEEEKQESATPAKSSEQDPEKVETPAKTGGQDPVKPETKPATEEQDPVKPEAKPATEEQDPVKPEAKPATEEQDPVKPETKPAESGNDEKPKVDDPANVEPEGDQKDAKPQPAATRQIVSVVRELKVSPPISGKSLRSLLVEASRRAELEVEEDQVELSSPDENADESFLTTVSETWTVKMEVARESEGDVIFQEWSNRFNTTPYFPTVSKVGGQIAGETQLQAMAAIFASLLGIIAYVWIRFQNVAFGLAAVIALIHDVMVVVGAIAISHWVAGGLGFIKIDEFKISLEIVAALLTVIGYSLNDTIVVFDRIREVRGKRTEITAEMINTSISQTLSRTILTSLTTFIVVFILYWFGGDAIHGFAFALVVGVVVGTYSSIFIASPALLWLMNTVGLNPGEVDPATE